MAAHFEWCLRLAQGEWVTVLGDDDGLLPNFADEFSRIQRRHPVADVFICRRAYYFWPGCEDLYGDTSVYYSSKRRTQPVHGRRLLSLSLVGAKPFCDLPHIYTGTLVRRGVLDRLRGANEGAMIRHSSPDVYTGVLVALLAQRIVRSETPLFWIGASPKSNGFQIAKEQKGHSSTELAASATGATNPVSGAEEFRRLAQGSGLEQDDYLVEISTSLPSSGLICVAAGLSLPKDLREGHFLLRQDRFVRLLGVSHSLRALRVLEPRERSTKRRELLAYSKKRGIPSTTVMIVTRLVDLLLLVLRVVRSIRARVERVDLRLTVRGHDHTATLSEASALLSDRLRRSCRA